MKVISNWGNYPEIEARIESFYSEGELESILKKNGELIARGLGRCYGDSSLNDTVVSTLNFNRITAFNEEDGTITCEAGVSFADIIEVFLPRGFFLPVTPGTKFVTVGGAIASDVHGKNHHTAGTFRNHVISMDVMLHDGNVKRCSGDENAELFNATCGGMGLTGVILRATFRLLKVETAYVKEETLKAKNLEEIMNLFEESGSFSYSVAWIDLLAKGAETGRSVLMRGEHAKTGEVGFPGDPLAVKPKFKITVPFNLPGFVLNSLSVKIFNSIFYQRTRHEETSITDINSFFYPLDVVENWNRMYGRKGFIQYQLVLPMESSAKGLQEILAKVAEEGTGSFLAVLKLFGKEDGLISFPMEGYTLAMDFPVRDGLHAFLAELDALVLDHGGRLYLAKDARMSGEFFKKSYKRAEEFSTLRRSIDIPKKFASLQSKRLGI